MPAVPPNILVVEDDRETQALIAKYLRNNACNVTTANDGREMARAISRPSLAVVTLQALVRKYFAINARVSRSSSTTRMFGAAWAMAGPCP
jgi:DNA-binding response OmpR family regulator